MDQDSGGKPHVRLGNSPEPEDRVESVHVLVAIQPDGGEGIYGHVIDETMFNFATSDLAMKDLLERFIREQGSVEVCRRDGIKLEWRIYREVTEVEEVT